MVDQGNADTERVSEMHGGHGSQGIDVVSLHPDRLCVVAANAVEEAILRREEAWWHTWVKDEDAEGEKVGEGHGSTDCCESCVGWCYIIPECDETRKEKILVKGILSIFPDMY